MPNVSATRYYYVADPQQPLIGHVVRADEDGGQQLGDEVPFTMAEARITTWALNRVAEGYILNATVRCEHEPMLEYDGPTEGIAP